MERGADRERSLERAKCSKRLCKGIIYTYKIMIQYICRGIYAAIINMQHVPKINGNDDEGTCPPVQQCGCSNKISGFNTS